MTKALGNGSLESYNDLDSAVRVIRDNAFVDEQLRGTRRYVPLSDSADWPVATWWPTTAPRLFRHPSGRVWLDVLQSMLHGASNEEFALIVHQRLDVTDLVSGPDNNTVPEPPTNLRIE